MSESTMRIIHCASVESADHLRSFISDVKTGRCTALILQPGRSARTVIVTYRR